MVYLVPILARIIAGIGALLGLFACYIYIQFYNYDRCEYYSNTYEHPCLICSSSVPDGKTQRRERRAKAIRRRKGRL